VLFIYTNLRTFADANVLAQRYRYMWSIIPLEVDCTEIGIKTLDARVGDVASVNYAPAPTLTKAFSGALFNVTRLQQDFAKPLNMSFTLTMIRGTAGTIGFWQDVGAPDWATATDVERASSGFWCDDEGFADPSDPTSYRVSLWW
jgi:hypothetical protein